MTSTVAALSLVGKVDGKDDFTITVEIGAPYEIGPDEWACPVSVQPLYGRLLDQPGGDSFQALFLAMRLAMSLLKDFTVKGGSLFMIDENFPDAIFPFEAYRWVID